MFSIKQKVQNLIKKFETNDPFKIASSLNIIVNFEPLGNTLGYFSSHRRFKFIHINNNIDEILQRFVCAHELGHAVIHPKANTPFLKSNTYFSIDKIEVEANTFAVELLIPDAELNELVTQGLTLNELATRYNIPPELSHLKKL